jgi:hypothetical protein
MPPIRIALTLAGTLLLGACASKSYCLGQQKYDHVASIAPIHAVDDLQIPDSPTAMRVPPPVAPDQDLPYGQRVADPRHPSRTKVQCLDEPPPLPPSAAVAPTGS